MAPFVSPVLDSPRLQHAQILTLKIENKGREGRRGRASFAKVEHDEEAAWKDHQRGKASALEAR